MKKKKKGSTMSPLLSIVIIAFLAIIFFSIAAFTRSLEAEVDKANEFVAILSQGVKSNYMHYQAQINEMASLDDMSQFVATAPEDRTEAMFSDLIDDIAGLVAGEPYIEAVILHDESKSDEVILMKSEAYHPHLTIEKPSQWGSNELGWYRTLIGQADGQDKMMIQVPIDDHEEPGYLICMQVDISGILADYFSHGDYDVDMMTHDGKHLVNGEKFKVVDELYDIYGADIFMSKDSFELTKEHFYLSEIQYFRQHIIASVPFNELMSVVVIKPYNRFALENSKGYLLGQLGVIGIMIFTMVGTMIYSSSRTNQWVENDRQFLNEMIEMNKIHISELKKEVKFHTDFFDESMLPMMIIDKESLRLMNVNQKAIDFYGYDEDELLELYLSDICKWENNVEDVSGLIQVHHFKKDKTVEENMIRVQEVNYNDSEMLVIMIIGKEPLALQNMKQMKVEMFHEIRSPLQSAIGAVEKIESASNHYSEYTGIIRRSLNNVLTMTNNVLAEGKLSSQMNKVFETEFDLVPMINEIISIAVYQDKNYNILASNINEVIDNTLAPIHHYQIKTDPVKLRQILVNLVSNGTKYTEDGMVNLSVEIMRESQKDIVVFRVSDTGIGLTKEQIDHLYDDYETFVSKPGITSTGLGLTITKKYVELLGSELHVNSELGVGTTFSFSLELESSEISPQNYEEHSLLVVDDDEVSASYLEKLIRSEMSCHVKSLYNETDLLLELNRHNYDCLIIDQNLNHFKGTDFIELIRKSFNDRIRNIPIILITAELDIESILEKGQVQAVLQKPFSNDEIRRVINTLLANDLEAAYAFEIDEQVVNKAAILETIESVGRDVFIELVGKFIINSKEEMQIIERLILEEDYAQMKLMLHRLKGAMSYFSPVKCMPVIQGLEEMAMAESHTMKETFNTFVKLHADLINELRHISHQV